MNLGSIPSVATNSMILTDRPNKKAGVLEPPPKKSLTLEELKARKPKREVKLGRDDVIDQGCDCEIKLDAEITEDTQQAIWFYNNPLNHETLCLYRVLCKE